MSKIARPPPAPGPHVMEVVVKEAQLQWPYLLQMAFLWDLVGVYTRCVFVPWVDTLREVCEVVS